MNYLRAITTEESMWGKDVFVKRAMVNDDNLKKFIKWQFVKDKTIKWIPENFEGKNKNYIYNIISEYKHEWIFDGKWKLINR
jgi:hypothetical protein